MIFIDESGDDGVTKKSSQNFFVVTALFSDIEKVESENTKIRKILNFKNTELKWNKLNKNQKKIFKIYSKKISYKIDYAYIDKTKDNKTLKYYNVAENLLDRNRMFLKNEMILYKGEHLSKMFETIRRSFAISGTKFKHREIIGLEFFGIEIADLWAGYLHSELKRENELSNFKL